MAVTTGAQGYTGNGQAAPAPAADTKGAVRSVPFTRGAYKARANGETKTLTLSTAVQSMPHIIPAIGGWNRRIGLRVVATTAANAAAVAFTVDGPWNVLSQVLLKDAAQKQLILWTNGYHGYVANLYGGMGYLYRPDGADLVNGTAAVVRGYSQVTGAVGTGGSFAFTLLLPQKCSRDGIGSYPNMDSSQRLALDLSLNTIANVYSVAPTTPPSVSITPVVYYYTKPAAVDARGQAQDTSPPGAGTLQFWRTLSIPLDAGVNLRTINLSGRYIRNMLGIFTDGSDVRSDTVRPTSIRGELDNNLIFDADVAEWDSTLERTFGVKAPTGVLPFHLGTTDPDGIPGYEWSDDWWYTTTSSQFVFKFSTGAAGKLYLLLNEVEAQGSIFR